MAKKIMILGTMSNVGKSIIVAGLCRIFHQDGYSVAPFKSQNMALNSYVTKDGLEMGRAQVMQAEAAGIDPSVNMNPILLKPTCDEGSQVIVNGEILGNFSAKKYYEMKKGLLPEIRKAYEKLDRDYDILVIEGAGSPAEINLNQDDIVNMGIAKMAQSPALLVGDIDKGGVFAQLYGTVELLKEDERSMIRGLIINKFRGDRTILDPGCKMIHDLTGIPVIGVTPYMDIRLDDEDSLSPRLSEKKSPCRIDLAVVCFPHISNFTDFNIFENMDDVSVRYVESPSELGNPDLIFLPGSKNTMSDLLWMRQSGIENTIIQKHASGTPIFGICGGYQMLGETISDPFNVEQGGTMRGMGLIPVKTVFSKNKKRTQAKGNFAKVEGMLSSLSGIPVSGYEIHMGESEFCSFDECYDSVPLLQLAEEPSSRDCYDGISHENIYGTYLHGIFDEREAASALIGALASYKGFSVPNDTKIDYREYKEEQYNQLANSMRKYLDLKSIYTILEEGV